MIGQRLGRYEITDKLGEGGMGVVYRAADDDLGREVALKMLPEDVRRDEARLSRFDREAKALAALNHPGIAQIYGLERTDDATALVMELVEGPTLADRLAQGPLPREEALGIAHQIAEALEEAHSRGIVHRDLKPQNVKLARDGAGGWRAKVLDFGLAKASVPPERRRRVGGGADPVPHAEPRMPPGRAWSSAPPVTCRPSRPRASRSTSAPTCGRSGSCSGRC